MIVFDSSFLKTRSLGIKTTMITATNNNPSRKNFLIYLAPYVFQE